jgi:hypothetical protein
MNEVITQEQAQKLLAFVTDLARAEANHDYPCGNVGDHLSMNWQYRAEDLLDELDLNRG